MGARRGVESEAGATTLDTRSEGPMCLICIPREMLQRSGGQRRRRNAHSPRPLMFLLLQGTDWDLLAGRLKLGATVSGLVQVPYTASDHG
jgi:hypothetical protein